MKSATVAVKAKQRKTKQGHVYYKYRWNFFPVVYFDDHGANLNQLWSGLRPRHCQLTAKREPSRQIINRGMSRLTTSRFAFDKITCVPTTSHRVPASAGESNPQLNNVHSNTKAQRVYVCECAFLCMWGLVLSTVCVWHLADGPIGLRDTILHFSSDSVGYAKNAVKYEADGFRGGSR